MKANEQTNLNLPLSELVADLESLLKEELVSTNDREFAESLVNQFNKRNALSDKQVYWVGVLIQRSVEGDEPKSEPEKVDLGSFGPMIGLFNKAKQHLKYPKIYLQTMFGNPVALSVAGPNAKHPGSINVTDGGPYGDNEWYGRVLTTGEYEVPKNKADLEQIANLLQVFAADPAKTASAHGHLTGNCCFCMKKLTDEKSTSVGYGKKCASNYGLPWGHTS